MRVVRLHVEVGRGAGLRVVVGDLGREVGRLAGKGQVAGVCELLGDREVRLGHAIVHAEGQSTGQEADLEKRALVGFIIRSKTFLRWTLTSSSIFGLKSRPPLRISPK